MNQTLKKSLEITASILKLIVMIIFSVFAWEYWGVKEYVTSSDEPTSFFVEKISDQLRSQPQPETPEETTPFCIDGRSFVLFKSGAIIANYDAHTPVPMCEGTSYEVLSRFNQTLFNVGFKCFNNQTFIYLKRFAYKGTPQIDMFNWYKKCD